MSALTEPNYTGDWLKYEINPDFCREEVTIESGQDLVSGSVLGKVSASGYYKLYNNDAATGEETAAGIIVEACDATSAAKKAAVVVRGPAVISKAGLTWKSDQHDADKTAAYVELLAAKLVARD